MFSTESAMDGAFFPAPEALLYVQTQDAILGLKSKAESLGGSRKISGAFSLAVDFSTVAVYQSRQSKR